MILTDLDYGDTTEGEGEPEPLVEDSTDAKRGVQAVQAAQDEKAKEFGHFKEELYFLTMLYTAPRFIHRALNNMRLDWTSSTPVYIGLGEIRREGTL